MSGRRKGAVAQREAADELRAFGLRVLLALRDGVRPDVDALVQAGPGRWITLQIKREEAARPDAWIREYVRPGGALMYRRNREPWTVVASVPEPALRWLPLAVDVERFAALVLGGVL